MTTATDSTHPTSDIFRHGSMVQLSVSAWTGRVKLPPKRIMDAALDTDPAFVGAFKRLVDADALAKIASIGAEARRYVYSRSLPFPVEGAVFVPTPLIPEVDARLAESKARYESAVSNFVSDFEAFREQARLKLGQLFDARDYPKDVARRFGMDWRFVVMAPAGQTQLIDPMLVAREQERFADLMQRAQREAVGALRVRFAELVDHAVDRLAGGRDGGKPKVFRDTLVENWRDFVSVFSALNISDDVQLTKLVETCEAALSGVDAKDLRDDTKLREHVACKLSGVQQNLDAMLADRPTRKITIKAV